MTIGRRSIGLLDQHRDRPGFEHQPNQPRAVPRTRITWRQEDPAADEDAMCIGHQRAEPCHGEVGSAQAVAAGGEVVDVGADVRRPVARVRGIDGVLAGASRCPQGVPGPTKAAGFGVDGEHIGAGSDGEHQHCDGAEQHEAGGDLLGPRPQEARFDEVDGRRGRPHRKDHARRGVDGQVGGIVERCDGHQKRRAGLQDDDPGRLLRRDGRDRGIAECLHQQLVGDEVDVAEIVAVGAESDDLVEIIREHGLPQSPGKVDGRLRQLSDGVGDSEPRLVVPSPPGQAAAEVGLLCVCGGHEGPSSR